MTFTQGTAIIRGRGQLTIPEKIRGLLKWPTSNSVVSIAITTNSEILIKPYASDKIVDWTSFWKEIKRVRSFKGKRGNLSKFVALDRTKH